jgi:hypothetical protein
MKKLTVILFFSGFYFSAMAQQDSAKAETRVLIVPYQTMMHFSDADEDIASFSHKNIGQVRNQLRLDLESNVYHQLLASFDAISLLRANTMNGEEDLNKIYAATHYQVYSKEAQEAYHVNKQSGVTESLKAFTTNFKHTSNKQTYWTSDSSVMLGVIKDPAIFHYLHKKYNEKYILFLTQFEMNTSNKNTLEWVKQDYKREYTVHYNLFDNTGVLIRAEAITIKAGNENTLEDIKKLYLIVLAQKLKDILQAVN